MPKLTTSGVQSAKCAGGTKLILKGYFTTEAVICGVKNEICLYVSDMINNDIILGSGSICDYDLFPDPRSNLVMTRKQLLRTFQTQIAAREKQLCTHLDAKAEHLGDMSWNRQTVCLFVTMRPAGTRCICELYWHSITKVSIIIPSTRSTLPPGLGQNPPRGPTATHHLSLSGLRYQTLLTAGQTSSPVEV
jgi:hypothetical protein